jgi:hypothetical protein
MSSQSMPNVRLARLVLGVTAILTSACAVYLHPLLRDTDTRFDNALIGRWDEADVQDSARAGHITITGDSASGYRVVNVDTYKDTQIFEGRLGTFAGLRLLELRQEAEAAPPGQYDLTLRLFAFVVIHRADARVLEISMVEPEAFEKAVREEPALSPWVDTDDGRLVLTGSSAQVREFMRRLLAQPGAISDTARFVRAP